MKLFNELDRIEQLDIIRFKSNNNSYYYSKIDQLTPEQMIYNGEKFNITAVYQNIINGLNTYEIYKLTMTSSEANEILRESAESIIKEFYATKVDTLISSFDTFANKMSETITKAAGDISDSDSSIKVILDDVKSFKTQLSDNIDNLDLSRINDKLQEKLSDVKEVKDQFMTDLKPVTTELGSLISSLHEIVKPKQ